MEMSNSRLPVTDEEIVRHSTVCSRLLKSMKQRVCYGKAVLGLRRRDTTTGTAAPTTSRFMYKVAPETFTLLRERKVEVERHLTSTLRFAVCYLSTDRSRVTRWRHRLLPLRLDDRTRSRICSALLRSEPLKASLYILKLRQRRVD